MLVPAEQLLAADLQLGDALRRHLGLVQLHALQRLQQCLGDDQAAQRGASASGAVPRARGPDARAPTCPRRTRRAARICPSHPCRGPVERNRRSIRSVRAVELICLIFGAAWLGQGTPLALLVGREPPKKGQALRTPFDRRGGCWWVMGALCSAVNAFYGATVVARLLPRRAGGDPAPSRPRRADRGGEVRLLVAAEVGGGVARGRPP